jgi:dTDP-4-amino-4,6-dideoxygalactose transaminase
VTLALLGGTPVRSDPFPPRRTVGADERAAVLEVLDSGELSQFIAEWGPEFGGGPFVRGAEAAFAERLGARHAVAVNSATTGLQVAVAAAGVPRGSEVLVSPYTMSASAAAVWLHGATPVFADIEDESYGLDPEAVAAAIGPDTSAILVTHLFGHPARMDGLRALADRHGLAIIEDAAQSIGATYHGRETGVLGTVGVLSLNYHKIIHSGEGGIVVTDDDDVALRARLVRNHGEVSAEAAGIADAASVVGSNYRMTEIEAAIARVQLGRLEELLAHRRRLAERLSGRLAQLPGIEPGTVAAGCTHSWYVFPAQIVAAELGLGREQVVRALAAEGVPVQSGYVAPLYRQGVYRQALAAGTGHPSWRPGSCPVVERLHDGELVYADVARDPLTDRDVDDVADAFEKVVAHADALRAAT